MANIVTLIHIFLSGLFPAPRHLTWSGHAVMRDKVDNHGGCGIAKKIPAIRRVLIEKPFDHIRTDVQSVSNFIYYIAVGSGREFVLSLSEMFDCRGLVKEP
ncbi:MAG TPA: hypothetical protein VE954_24785 [Oligoflexus sp.]|uniref:hypothetical protein n=1 Tax=Oligoflexus sp. TaxID=1971216 RepID=UPI002D49C91E|nr:hypothetical protein [Oligoflexus sp.]HYX36334.1 hypothetical protein [Oligoflexus sp.]